MSVDPTMSSSALSGEDLVTSLGITRCCYCLDHSVGVTLLGVINVGMSVMGLLLTLWWIVLVQNDCMGPVYIPPDQNCTQYLDSNSQFRQELAIISKEMRNYKLRLATLIGLIIVFSILWLGFSISLTFGAYKENKLFLIPWLIIAKIGTLLLLVLTVCIIFLEARFFAIGTTVFGLFSLLTLFLACFMAYLWLVTQSLYNRIEQMEFEPRGLNYGNGHINRGFSEEAHIDILNAANDGRKVDHPDEIDMYEINPQDRDPSWEAFCQKNGCQASTMNVQTSQF